MLNHNYKMGRKFFFFVIVMFYAFFVCNSYAEPAKIFWCADGTFGANDGSQFAKLKRSDLDGSNIVTIRTSTIDSMRGCHYDSAQDKIFLTARGLDQYDKIVRIAPDNSSETIMQTIPVFPGSSESYYISGGMATSDLRGALYWTDNVNSKIKFASKSNPLVADVLNPQNVPESLLLSSNVELNFPFDVEVDSVNDDIYVANANGGITRINLDGTGGENIILSGGILGVALDPTHHQIFYTTQNNQIWTAGLNGSSPTELTQAIGQVVSHYTNRLSDIDYDVDTDKIYWLEYADPIPPFGIQAVSGKLRRANPNGSNVEEVMDVGFRAQFLTLQYGTLSPYLLAPNGAHTYVSSFPFSYHLREPALAGSIKLLFKQGNKVAATLSFKNSSGTNSMIIHPFEASLSDIDPGSFVDSVSNFPIAQGSYTLELTYQDIVANTATTDALSDVTLLLPTATATTTATPTKTPSGANPPAIIITSTPTPKPTFENIGPDPTPTLIPQDQCISSLKIPKVSKRGDKIVVSFSAKKSKKYTIFAKPIGSSGRKAQTKTLTASRDGKVQITFGPLKNGIWQFSYRVRINKLVTTSCVVQKLV